MNTPDSLWKQRKAPDQVTTGSHRRAFARLGVALAVPACLLLLLLIELGINARPAGAFGYLSPMKKQYEPVLEPASAAQSGDPGTTVTYALMLTNGGNHPDTFTVTVGSTAFTTIVTPSIVGPLSAGASRSVTVTVQIPANAAGGLTDTATITAASKEGSVTDTDSSTLTTTVNMMRHVALAPASAAQSGDPGATVTYTLVLTNAGNTSDTFTVTVGSTAFTTTVTPSSVGPLSAGASRSVTVTVQIPAGAAGGFTDTATLTATSHGDVTKSAGSILTTTVNLARRVSLAPPTAAQSGYPGATVTYTLVLTNAGNYTDTFTLTVGSTAFTTTVTPSSVGPLGQGLSQSVAVTVQIPAGAAPGVSDTAIITATSWGNSNQSANSILTTASIMWHVALAPASAARSGDPGAMVTYTLVLTNTGNALDTFTLTAGSSMAFTTTVTPSSVGPLSAGASRSVTVTVQIPAGAAGGLTDAATLTATSQGDASQSARSTLTTTVNLVRHVALAPTSAAQLGNPGTTVTYTLVLTNAGNASDTFTLTVGGAAFTTTVAPSSVGPLSAGASRSVTVTVQIPAGAAGGLTDAATLTATSQGDATKSASSILTTAAATANAGRSVYLPVVQKGFFCDQYEPNDSRPINGGTPWGPLVSGQIIQSQICPGDPRDLYYFDASSAAQVTINLTGLSGSADFGLYLWNETGTTALANSRKGAGRDEKIIYNLPESGRYYIDIYPWSGSGSYTLQGQGSGWY